MATNIDGVAEGATVRLGTWRESGDAGGHDPRSGYVETFWLPVLGPSTTLLIRRLALMLEVLGEGALVQLDEVASALGLGQRSGRHGPFGRSLQRAVDFHALRVASDTSIEVRHRLPTLSHRHVARLPEGLRREHERVVRAASAPAGQASLPERARRLALSLAELGDGAEEVAAQLVEWNYGPEVAGDLARWAETEIDRRRRAGDGPHREVRRPGRLVVAATPGAVVPVQR